MSPENYSQDYFPSYPAPVHSASLRKGAVTAEQPAPAQRMSIQDSQQRGKEGRAERPRGGCVPCPNGGCCFIIPLPCC
ncbi:hypothetical protein M413DRAFT_447535 [Hebeloma cylindrosporum]|uniref:Uncharacterized protein n=1 Tax=Hebeloma cylindrosporum TaxID=76867 RepID=A0A0C3C3H5_HEBCY|nr:hypothetical protein M413DRAFT_447535 [Hebeloma cylindrosporum h7]